jgi:hypothetical protein
MSAPSEQSSKEEFGSLFPDEATFKKEFKRLWGCSSFRSEYMYVKTKQDRDGTKVQTTSEAFSSMEKAKDAAKNDAVRAICASDTTISYSFVVNLIPEFDT